MVTEGTNVSTPMTKFASRCFLLENVKVCNGERGLSPIVKQGIGLGEWPEPR